MSAVHWSISEIPQIFGGPPGAGFGGASGACCNGGRITVSRAFFTRPLPPSFFASGGIFPYKN
jgi:hypothetical protein